MISVDDAIALLDRALVSLAPESVPIEDALGRVLSAPIVADRDFPPTDRSAMDGFAVRSVDLKAPGSLEISGELPAGADPSACSVGPGQACRVFTGAVIPAGADAVVMVEKTDQDREQGVVRIDDAPTAGQHIRKAAQDLRCGDPVLAAGQRIRSAEIAALASVGVVDVPVYCQPRVSVLSTGDEIVSPRETPAAHQIRNSNAPMLVAQVREAGFAALDLGNAPDCREQLRQKLRQGFTSDLLLVTGGVSVGDYDLVATELVDAGVEILFHGIAMKPGKPILAGLFEGRLVLGLPGNPLSAYVGFKLFGEPALRRFSGCNRVWPQRVTARLDVAIRCRPGRRTYHLAHIEDRGEGWIATPTRSTGSGDVLSLAQANALVVTEDDSSGVAAGAALGALLF
jgi:molybdopterin molybdotransferase